jgi:hypothetical protein
MVTLLQKKTRSHGCGLGGAFALYSNTKNDRAISARSLQIPLKRASHLFHDEDEADSV